MNDYCTPITNPNLLETMNKVGEGEQQTFIRELQKAKLLCPTIMQLQNSSSSRNGEIVVGKGSTIQLLGLSSREGLNYLMAFTDWGKLRKWNQQENQQTVIFTFEDYRNVVFKEDSTYEGFVINPFSENIIINRQSMINISQGPQQIQKGKSVMIGLPKEYPNDMVVGLKNYFDKAKIVKSAYLLWMAKGNETSYLLVLDFNGIPDKVIPKVAEVCRPFLKGKMLDIVSLTTSFGQNAIENQKPFYQS